LCAGIGDIKEEDIGSLSEDRELSVLVHYNNWRSEFLPDNLKKLPALALSMIIE
jgi:hypothetical protein